MIAARYRGRVAGLENRAEVTSSIVPRPFWAKRRVDVWVRRGRRGVRAERVCWALVVIRRFWMGSDSGEGVEGGSEDVDDGLGLGFMTSTL